MVISSFGPNSSLPPGLLSLAPIAHGINQQTLFGLLSKHTESLTISSIAPVLLQATNIWAWATADNLPAPCCKEGASLETDHAIPPLRNPWRLLLSFPITPSTSTTFTHVGSSPLHPPLSALTFSEFPCAPPCYRNHTRWASAWILGPCSCQEIKGWTMSKQQVQNSTNLEITGFGSSNEIITDVYMTICNVLFWYVCG